MKNNRVINFLPLYIAIALFFLSPLSAAKSSLSLFESHYKDIPVLVTGGCGFIGSHVVEKLVSLGAQVSVLDDLSSGNKNNIAYVEDTITYIDGSITDFNTCLRATKNKKIIFHLAAFISVPASTKNPYLCHEINVTGTQNILEAARINNVKRIVFSSSCAVYGESSLLCHETNTLNPTSPYGFSKLMGEIYCREYAYVFDMETVALRYFNVYGPRQDPYGHYAAVVAKFTHNMIHNLPITIFGDGTQTRDFVPVEMVVDANIFVGACDKELIKGDVFNVATGKSITLFQLIDVLKKKYSDYTGAIMLDDPRPGDVKCVAADVSKYKNLYDSIIQQNG